VAKDAGAGKLLLGHYSARYNELELLLSEAREVFPESYLSKEGETYTID
jgi:ribonuclease Z